MKGLYFYIGIMLFAFFSMSFALAEVSDNEAIAKSTKFMLEHTKPTHYGILLNTFIVDAKEVTRIGNDIYIGIEIYAYSLGSKRSRDVTVKMNEFGTITSVFVMKPKLLPSTMYM